MSQKPELHEEAPEATIGFIVGKIVDESGNPLEGVRIMTNDSATYSDAKGGFIIGDRPCLNPHRLMAYLEGFAVATQQELLLVEGERQGAELKMLRIPVCVSGVVKDAKTLAKLPGVHICLGSHCNPSVDTPPDGDGSYVLCDEPPGYYILTATKGGYQDWNNNGIPVKIPSTKTIKMKKLRT